MAVLGAKLPAGFQQQLAETGPAASG